MVTSGVVFVIVVVVALLGVVFLISIEPCLFSRHARVEFPDARGGGKRKKRARRVLLIEAGLHCRGVVPVLIALLSVC